MQGQRELALSAHGLTIALGVALANAGFIEPVAAQATVLGLVLGLAAFLRMSKVSRWRTPR